MDVLKIKSTYGPVALYNAKIKSYADNSKKIKMYDYSIAKGLCRKKKSGGGSSPDDRAYSRYKHLYESRSNLIDLVYHNSLIKPWEYFVTLTFDPKEVDSLDYEVASKALAKWLDNIKHQNKHMAYVLVPEFHKSGRIHFHGLFRDVPNWVLKESRYKGGKSKGRLKVKNGVQIYDLVNYKHGYCEVGEIKNQAAVSVYMSKYMTKSLIDLNFKKRYWSSRNLERPSIEYAMFNEATKEFYIATAEVSDLYRSTYSTSFTLTKEVNII